MSQTCPECDSKLQIPANLAGKRVRCPKCKSPFVVSAAESASRPKAAPPKANLAKSTRSDSFQSFEPKKKRREYVDDDFDDAAPTRSKSAKRKRKKAKAFPWLLVGTGGGALVILAVVLIVVISTSGPTHHPKLVKAEPELPKRDEAKPGAKPPIAVKEPLPAAFKEPMPATIAADSTQRVKRSTVHLQVQSATGDKGQGSGFLYHERGLVVTNAHVVGMLHSDDKPVRVDVTFNSNQPDEITRPAAVLGVDHEDDLALLRVHGDASGLPPPLQVDVASPLSELQEVYVFGFPLGTQLGKDISASKTSISSLRKNAAGNLSQIQVNGGMHSGNSGGPVVDARGNVIGVSVAVIRGTQINFAVPAEKIHGLLEGRIASSNFGEPYRDGTGSVRLPVKVTCLDPLSKIQSMKLEVWTGPDGPPRPASATQPAAQLGDSKRTIAPLKYSVKQGQADIALPELPDRKTLWVQPVFTLTSGTSAWGPALTVPSARETPLNRVATKLALKFDVVGERTLALSSRFHEKIMGVTKKTEVFETVEAKILESILPKGANALVKLHPGQVTANHQLPDNAAGAKAVGAVRSVPFDARAIPLFCGMDHSCVLDPQGKLLDGCHLELSPEYDPKARREAGNLAILLRNAYEAAAFTVPDKNVTPMETWFLSVPIFFGGARDQTPTQVSYACTYEGLRTSGAVKEAFIRFEGELRPKLFPNGDIVKAKIEGAAHLDLERGYFSKVRVAIRFDIDAIDVYLAQSTETTWTRTAGNPQGLVAAAAVKMTPAVRADGAPIAPLGPVAGTKILDQEGTLRIADPILPERNAPHQVVRVNLTQGKAYVIDLLRVPGDRYDPFLVLQDASGKPLAQDDDSGGDLNSRIGFVAPSTGEYRIVVTACDPIQRDAPFRLRVTEVMRK